MKKIIIAIITIILAINLVGCSKKEGPKTIIDWEFGSCTANIVTVDGDNANVEVITSSIGKVEFDNLMDAYNNGIVDEDYVFNYIFAEDRILES